MHVRDSKEQRGPILSVSSGQWAVFVRHVAGEQEQPQRSGRRQLPGGRAGPRQGARP
ncbi:DUF397 domain-containing protein [Streptomyces albus]|uniref:DUF397 domain-containing protein n=1 Tax=Streptomyces albus TaxID=1888 RepID=UPI001F302E0D